jgi:hypothetical protein
VQNLWVCPFDAGRENSCVLSRMDGVYHYRQSAIV